MAKGWVIKCYIPQKHLIMHNKRRDVLQRATDRYPAIGFDKNRYIECFIPNYKKDVS